MRKRSINARNVSKKVYPKLKSFWVSLQLKQNHQSNLINPISFEILYKNRRLLFGHPRNRKGGEPATYGRSGKNTKQTSAWWRGCGFSRGVVGRKSVKNIKKKNYKKNQDYFFSSLYRVLNIRWRRFVCSLVRDEVSQSWFRRRRCRRCCCWHRADAIGELLLLLLLLAVVEDRGEYKSGNLSCGGESARSNQSVRVRIIESTESS